MENMIQADSYRIGGGGGGEGQAGQEGNAEKLQNSMILFAFDQELSWKKSH